MMNQTGLYYRAYANAYDPKDPSTGFATGHIMGSTGSGQFWDFSGGPTNRVYRYDYLSPAGIAEAADFPEAKIAEKKTTENSPDGASWLFFEQVQAVGRKVYGFYDSEFSADTPSNVFNPAITDFPDQIRYNDTWSTSTTILTSIAVVDPEIFDAFDAQITFTSTFKVDAYGTIELPKLGFDDGLRVNESQTIAIAVDLEGNGQFQNIETDYTRNYYWLRPGLGIVAQLNSTQNTTPPPDNFDQATVFTRLFETNKKPEEPCATPGSVNDLKISVNARKQVLLKWGAAACTSQYRVEYSSTGAAEPGSWKSLGNPISQQYYLDEAPVDSQRFYRIVSLK
jgi:hypothetical protein